MIRKEYNRLGCDDIICYDAYLETVLSLVIFEWLIIFFESSKPQKYSCTTNLRQSWPYAFRIIWYVSIAVFPFLKQNLIAVRYFILATIRNDQAIFQYTLLENLIPLLYSWNRIMQNKKATFRCVLLKNYCT